MPRQPTAPCGTHAGARRHYRRGEKPCQPCLEANRRDKSGNAAGQLSPNPMARNGIPEPVAYSWRVRTYPWAQRVLAAAEAIHGQPDEHDLDGMDYLVDSGYARAVSA